MMTAADHIDDRIPPGIVPLHRCIPADGTETIWFSTKDIPSSLRYYKHTIPRPFRMLYDLTCIDERVRRQRREQEPKGSFTLLYELYSFERNGFLRIKSPLADSMPSAPSITEIWPAANWYEREVWDMFGVTFTGHPRLSRILMPKEWPGHPLRKEHPARGTEMGPYQLSEAAYQAEQDAMQFRPEEWGAATHTPDGKEYLFLNLGPQHPGTHGPFRIVVQLDGELMVDVFPDIGYHHRAQEKLGERQSWHTYIPYTDRVDYLAGFLNELPYLLSVEKLAGIEIPDRAKVIRVMLCELFRIISHLVWYGTFAQDVGAMSPVFYMFNDRERALDIIRAITGARMHPSWFRIGGVAADLPSGWEQLFRDFLDYLPKRLAEYDSLVMRNGIFKQRTVGVGGYTLDEAIEWGITGPGLRACGLEWDFRKKQPYSGYDQFEFQIPTAVHGDCYDRAVVRIEEMRQSLRIIEQCVKHMPAGAYISDHPLATPPRKERTLQDIETLIHHFLTVSWGPVIPPGECRVPTEAAKGSTGYLLISDGNTVSYRTRVRSPSFPHLQMLPLIARGGLLSDLLAILGSMDYVMGDVDR